jgi:integrase/recombinase XerD
MNVQRPTMQHAEDFLASIDVAPKTDATYRYALCALAEFVSGNRTTGRGARAAQSVAVRLLQEDTLARFRHWMRHDRKLGRRTEGTYLAAAIRFAEWLEANGLLEGDITSSRMRLLLKNTRGRRRVGYRTQPIKEAVPLILAHYDEEPLPSSKTPQGRRQRLTLLRNRAIVHTLFATGLRAQELASLRRSDCADGASDKMLITGKGEKERLVMLNSEAQAAIRAYLKARDEDRDARRIERAPASAASEPVFIRHDRDRLVPITTKTVWQVVSQASKALGLGSTISPHDFRRYIATTLLSEGMPLESVQAFLGHESIVTTRTVYAHTWSEVLDDQVKTYRPSPAEAKRRAAKGSSE